jgi:tRNA nucleotidyltransferase (CCA-adding enzyme)
LLLKNIAFHLNPFILNQQPCVPALVSVLSPQTWPFSLEFLPETAYLVGGNVRDALLGRPAEYLDLDFVLPSGVVETAKAIASHYKAGFVLLDAERQIARVVFANATVDFAQQVGADLETDLKRRDFTINAIAYHPMTQQIFDPLQGAIDLRSGLIRMIAPENLKEDPLRLLRAYRQAAQLGFHLEAATQITIQQLAHLLETVAAERVQAELNYLLSTAQGTKLLIMAWQDGLLHYHFPYITSESIERLRCIDQAAIALGKCWSEFGIELLTWIREQTKTSGARRSWLKIAKLVCLVTPDLAVAEQELWQLKYSRAEVQAVLAVLKALPRFQSVDLPTLTLRDQYFLFKEIGGVFLSLVVLAVALGTPVEAIAPLVERFLDPTDPVAHPTPLLSGRDLMQQLHLSAGPQIGQLLELIQLAQAEGKISNPEEAVHFAKHLVSSATSKSDKEVVLRVRE